MQRRAEGILTILDRCCEVCTFPMLDNGYVYPAATRMSLYRSTEDWGMVIEVFGFSPRAGQPDTLIYTFSSTVIRRETAEDYVSPEAFHNYLAVNPNNEMSYVYPIDDEEWKDPENWDFVADTAKSLKLRGRDIDLPNSKDYFEAGVELSEPPRIRTFELCRVLAHQYRDDVLATGNERRVNLRDELELILTLDEWCHPDYADGTTQPSGLKTFRQLAAVLETGQIGLYRPSESPNTHWRNWPDGGTL